MATTVGIIGFGSFGKFLAEKLSKHCKVRVYSASGKTNKWASSLKEVAQADYLLLAIPLNAYTKTLQQIRPLVSAKTVVVDICSVKVQPLKILGEELPGQTLVATHPLFGPESAGKSLVGHTLVICPESSNDAAANVVEKLALKLKLNVVKMSANEHDREMANVHGLTFFIAQTLAEMGLSSQKLVTPSFKKLLALAELESHHTQDLFDTIQSGNTYTKPARRKFIKLATELDESIDQS